MDAELTAADCDDVLDRLLCAQLPSLLHEHVCKDQALALQLVLLDTHAEDDDVIDMLDTCAIAGVDFAANLADDAADTAERVGTLARHLAQYFALRDVSMTVARRHLARAAKIAAELQRPEPGQMAH